MLEEEEEEYFNVYTYSAGLTGGASAKRRAAVGVSGPRVEVVQSTLTAADDVTG